MTSDSLRLFSLRGRVALVSGASRGIGHAIAQGLAGAGATVIGFGRSTLSALPSNSAGFSYRSCDVNDQSQVHALCQDTYKSHGRLDIYVHAAGITLPAKGSEQDIEQFAATLQTNLTSAYLASLESSAPMAMSGGGSIIHITSIGSAMAFPNNPGYVSAKGGLRMLTKALALDFANKRIRVNAIAPGYIHTAMTEASFADPQLHAERLAHMMIKRWGTPEDIVGAAIFLASDASAYVTGQDIFVDGGWTAKGL